MQCKSFILLAFVVRDQEVGGSNPLAPTIFPQFRTAILKRVAVFSFRQTDRSP